MLNFLCRDCDRIPKVKEIAEKRMAMRYEWLRAAQKRRSKNKEK